MWAPAEKRVQREKQCGKENQQRQVPMAPPWMSQVAPFCWGEGTAVCAQTLMYTHVLQPLSVEEPGRDITTFLLSTRVCSLSADVCWALSGAGSALRAEAGRQVEVPAPGPTHPDWAGAPPQLFHISLEPAQHSPNPVPPPLQLPAVYCPSEPRKTFIKVLT